MWILVVAIVLGVFYLVLSYGRYLGGHDQTLAAEQRTEYKEAIEILKKEIVRLRKAEKSLISENAVLERFSRIDREAYNEIRKSQDSQQQVVGDIERDLNFYKELVSPERYDEKILVQEFSLHQIADSTYRYKLVVAVPQRGQRVLRTNIAIQVFGALGNREVDYQFKELTPQGSEFTDVIELRYFKELQGEIVLPKGFSPKTVFLSIVPPKKTSRGVEVTYNWPSILRSEDF